ncbi:hypothetical protein N9995_00160 [bacterium]|nr:hypothetical protein [bacterium]
MINSDQYRRGKPIISPSGFGYDEKAFFVRDLVLLLEVALKYVLMHFFQIRAST